MKTTTTLLIALALIISVKSFGQQDAMYSQYMFNQLLINPAYAGNHEVLSANALFRDQWVGIDGAPVTETFSLDAPLFKNKVGLGVTVYNDKIGISKNTGGYLAYAYRIKFRKSTLAFGLQAGLSNLRASYDQVEYSQNNSMYDYAFSKNINELFPNFGAGLFYNSEKFYFGLSVPYLLKKSLFQHSNIEGYIQARHFFLSTGYVIKFNKDYVLKPSILVKYVNGAPLEVDFNANLWFYEMLGVGASYRTGDAMIAMLELRLNNQLSVGYAFDYSLTELNKFNYGSHELMLKYDFNFSKTRIVTPRYF